MDISSLFQILEQIKKSHHNDSFDIMEVVSAFSREAIKLCRTKTLSEENSLKCQIEIYDTRDNVEKEISERITYPGWYSYNKLERQEIKEDELDSDCTLDCGNSFEDSARTVIFSSQAEYFRLYNKIKNRNKGCQNNILRNLGNELYLGIPERCLKRENKSHPVCKDMLNYVNTIRDRMRQLSELAYGRDVLKNTEAQMPCTECAINSESEHPLLDFFNTLNEQSQCFDLEPGEEKIVHPGTRLYKHGSYTVQRKPDGSYSIALNLQFLADEDYDGEVPKDQVPQHYMKEVQKCIKQANKGMLGPKGEKLQIVINEPPQNDNCSAARTEHISIGSKDHRSNSGKYESDASCSTITHEILHLLGLCDEYEEQSKGFYVNSKTGDIKFSKSLDEDEKNKLKSNKDYEFKLAYDCRVKTEKNIMSSSYKIKIGSNKPLLTPGQFNSILYGSCSQKNKIFNECSKLAYQSSVQNPDCIEKRNQCESQNVQGLNKQEEIEKLKRIIKPHERMLNYLNERADFIRNGGKVPDSSPIPRLMPSDDPESEPLMMVINRLLPLREDSSDSESELSTTVIEKLLPLAKLEDSSDSESELSTTVNEKLLPLAKLEDSSDSVKAGTSKNPQNAKRTSLDYRHQRRLDSLNFDIEFQKKVVDNLKRKLKRVEAWPD